MLLFPAPAPLKLVQWKRIHIFIGETHMIAKIEKGNNILTAFYKRQFNHTVNDV